MGEAILSKYLIQFSIDVQSCVLFLLFTWGQTMVEVVKIMVTSFKKSHASPAILTAPCSRPPPTHASAWHPWASLGRSLVGSLLLSSGSWCTQGFVCALQESVSPVLCKFWWLYGLVNGYLLQEGLCHTQVYCTQSPCPCSSLLLTHTSAEDSQTQFWFSLCGVSGSCVHKVCLRPPSVPLVVWGMNKMNYLHLGLACIVDPIRTSV